MENEQLIKKITSLCPECLQNIPAEIYWDKKDDKVYIRKKCEKHGEFKDRISSNPEHYIWQQNFTDEIGSTVNNSTTPENRMKNIKGCPYNCGLCDQHVSAPCICLIDLTNRCNLRCPVCFANSAATGYVYEPTFDEVVQIMEHFRNIKPIPPPMLQLSGGEPTLRKDLTQIISKGKELGFDEVMLTTNGIRIARSLEYTKQIKEAGCDTVYLSFDGVEPDTWKKTRGVNLYKVKMRAIENCGKAGITVVLVPTIVKGVNDHEIGNILDVARDNAGIVMGITFQPVSLVGRISLEDLKSMRYTTSDLQEAINKHTNGLIEKFYPIATTGKLTRLFSWFDDVPQFSMLSHEDCGFATLAIIDENNEFQPVEKYFDVEGLIRFSNEVWDMVQKQEIPKPTKIFNLDKILPDVPNIVRELIKFGDRMTDLTYRQIMKAYWMGGAAKYFKADLKGVLEHKNTYWNFLKLALNPSLKAADEFFRAKNIMISSMHFQDAYNFDLDRVSHCLVHYGVIDPDNPAKVLEIPFCSMNTLHREKIEEKLAKRKEERTNEEIDAEVQEVIKHVTATQTQAP